eukprot:scaffold661470_cov107-Prasinocladus_malaysianus.AAC.1
MSRAKLAGLLKLMGGRLFQFCPTLSATDGQTSQDLGAALHPADATLSVEASARMLALAARLNWKATLEEIMDTSSENDLLQECLLAADKLQDGILSASVQSRCQEVVDSVMSAVNQTGLSLDPCDLKGSPPMSAMHWAACLGLSQTIDFFKDNFPSAAEGFSVLRAGPDSRTAEEMLANSTAKQSVTKTQTL